ncbi:hypothetical protein QQS21_009887 [Conoideocrella luteorostrata]|uniref:Uncharacterized protein n=1 Tax=Conoideocrella luteorostrata TaxID=1105319 RepID=A0AAJ0CG93_9HYPO|nr:hypothetical protein QQS21_009887 [Conoideocrella luteorostrata]
MTRLSPADRISLLSPAKELQEQGKALAGQWKAKKDDIQMCRQCGTTYEFSSQCVTWSTALITAIVGKVPDSFKGILQTEGGKITQELKNTRDVFAPGNCSVA